ncbi:hypothetical protein L1887_25629 [Cichorium endivia]|nr:hypothetical protein L1887_25629 [Cichorium endivia]
MAEQKAKSHPPGGSRRAVDGSRSRRFGADRADEGRKFFEEVARIWGRMVYCSNEEKYSMNREVKQIGILTSEPPWINESVRVKINGSFHRIRVIENPSRSLNLAPRVDDQDQDQSSEGDWLDLGHNQWENVEEMEKEISNNQDEMFEAPLGNQQPTQTIESRGYRNKETGVEVQSPREVERSVWSSDVHAKDRGVGTSAEPLEQDGPGANRE